VLLHLLGARHFPHCLNLAFFILFFCSTHDKRQHRPGPPQPRLSVAPPVQRLAAAAPPNDAPDAEQPAHDEPRALAEPAGATSSLHGTDVTHDSDVPVDAAPQKPHDHEQLLGLEAAPPTVDIAEPVAAQRQSHEPDVEHKRRDHHHHVGGTST
jgi:hypothetical protein